MTGMEEEEREAASAGNAGAGCAEPGANAGTGTNIHSPAVTFHALCLGLSPVAGDCLEITPRVTEVSGSQDLQPWVLRYSENPSSWPRNSFFPMSPSAGQCMRNVSLPKT